MSSFERPTVFVLRALGLGDLLTAVPALRGLRRSHPDHRVVLATPGYLRPLVATMEFIDELHPVGEHQLLTVQLGVDDVAVNLHGRGPESTLRLLDTGPHRLVAFFHPDIPATFGSARWRRDEHEVQRWCRLLRHHSIPARPGELELVPPPPSAGVPTGAVVIHPGASAPARMWPPDRWAVVAREMRRRDREVLITGGRDEKALAVEIAREAGLGTDSVLAGATRLDELAAVIAAARLLVSSDTGPAHLATAYRTPSVVLFGPTAPSEWGPPPWGPHLALWAGRGGDPNAATPHEGLLEIGTAQVLEAAETVMDRPQVPASAAAASKSATS